VPPHFLVGYASETNCTCQLLELLLLMMASVVVKAETALKEGAGTEVEISEASPKTLVRHHREDRNATYVHKWLVSTDWVLKELLTFRV